MKDEKYIKEMQELENEAPTLFGLPKRNNFKVPEGILIDYRVKL